MSDSKAQKKDVDGASGPSSCSTLRFLSECKSNSRGFQIITFVDANDKRCELQQSSAIDDTERGLNNPGSSYVWLGVGCYSERMHLHRYHVQELIGVLQGWLKDGQLDA
jgi:hypothetical protein